MNYIRRQNILTLDKIRYPLSSDEFMQTITSSIREKIKKGLFIGVYDIYDYNLRLKYNNSKGVHDRLKREDRLESHYIIRDISRMKNGEVIVTYDIIDMNIWNIISKPIKKDSTHRVLSEDCVLVPRLIETSQGMRLISIDIRHPIEGEIYPIGIHITKKNKERLI